MRITLLGRIINCVIEKCIYIKHLFFVTFSLNSMHLKNILKVTPYQDIRKKIWIKLGNKIGERAYINNSINLIDTPDLEVNVILGNGVATAPGITFITCSAPNDSIIRTSEKTKRYIKTGTIEIGDDTWIGANCVIQPGVKIGKCCIIGSMSNVTKDIPDYSLAYGNPAKIVRKIEL
ncbi:MAG: acyltransferase [Treponema sp.]|nr:acyltransferase [Treponema sp.]